MMKSKMFILAGLIVALTLSGCITAQMVEKERVDQDLAGGNQGYLMGNPPGGATQAEGGTRQYLKVDVELPPYSLKNQTPDKEVYGNQGYVNQDSAYQEPKPTSIFPSRREMSEPEEIAAPTKEESNPKKVSKPKVATYKVQKNDSLSKIAKRPEIYGNGNKWRKIYEANKDKIKDPNKLRPGIDLVIPQD